MLDQCVVVPPMRRHHDATHPIFSTSHTDLFRSKLGANCRFVHDLFILTLHPVPEQPPAKHLPLRSVATALGLPQPTIIYSYKHDTNPGLLTVYW